MVDVGAGELCCDVSHGATEHRVDKVLLLEKGALVVRASASVVEGKDARVFLTKQVASFVLPTGCIVRRFRPCALTAALVVVSLVGKSVLLGNPG